MTVNSCRNCPFKHVQISEYSKRWYCNIDGSYVDINVYENTKNKNCKLNENVESKFL